MEYFALFNCIGNYWNTCPAQSRWQDSHILLIGLDSNHLYYRSLVVLFDTICSVPQVITDQTGATIGEYGVIGYGNYVDIPIGEFGAIRYTKNGVIRCDT